MVEPTAESQEQPGFDDIEADGDDIIAQVKGSRRDMRSVMGGVTTLAAEVSRTRTSIRLIRAAMATAGVAIVVGAIGLVGLWQQNQCLRVVVAATADRTGSLAPLRARLDQADRVLDHTRDGLVKDAINQRPRAQLDLDSKAFLTAKAADDKAYDAYVAAAAAAPLPKSPDRAC